MIYEAQFTYADGDQVKIVGTFNKKGNFVKDSKGMILKLGEEGVEILGKYESMADYKEAKGKKVRRSQPQQQVACPFDMTRWFAANKQIR